MKRENEKKRREVRNNHKNKFTRSDRAIHRKKNRTIEGEVPLCGHPYRGTGRINYSFSISKVPIMSEETV